jgi:HlyD family secretion protein
VFVVEGEKVVRKQVSTGIQDGTYIQIVSGLNEGEKVVTGPYELLSKDLAQGDLVKEAKKEKK